MWRLWAQKKVSSSLMLRHNYYSEKICLVMGVLTSPNDRLQINVFYHMGSSYIYMEIHVHSTLA